MLTKAKDYFTIAGMDKDSASLLSAVLSKSDLRSPDLPAELNLSENECNILLKKLVSEEVIKIASGGTIRITTKFAFETAAKLENSIERFSDKLKATRFLIVGKFANEIEKVFQVNGYKIKRGYDDVFRMIGGFEIRYAFIAEKFYRFGILVFSPEDWKKLTTEIPPRYLGSMIPELAERANCIGTFVFFDPKFNPEKINKIRKTLAESKSRYGIPRRGKFLLIHKPQEDIQDFLENNLNNIESMHDTVEQRFNILEDALRNTRDLVVENAMMISQLDSLFSGKYMPDLSRSEAFAPLLKPVKSVVDREQRNLEIFERKYEEEKSIVEGARVSFDKRLRLPDPSELTTIHERVVKLKSKFEPIRHELRFLSDFILFQYVKGDEPMKINPFILTEPNDIEAFTVNQNKIKSIADTFFRHLKFKGANLLFLVGAAGTGKTHILKHEFYSRATENNIWPIYVDCPMKYDIVSSLFVEIVQERNFPPAVHKFLPALRNKKVSTELEFVEIIKNLHDMMLSHKYNGIIFLVDELENSLPYTYDTRYESNFGEREETPLALRQLKGILSSELVRDTGFVFAFRNHILSEIEHSMKLKDFNSYVVVPEILNVNQFKELIELRYNTWNSKKIKFQIPVIKKIALTTDLNTRHTIQYFRALYQQAYEENRKTVTIKTLEKVGKIPLFSY